MGLLGAIDVSRHFNDVRRIANGGGPRAVSLLRIGEPRGLILQRSEVLVEVEARNGAKVRLDPDVPLPFMLGWAVRLARLLNAPLVSAVDPESFSFSVRLPNRSRR